MELEEAAQVELLERLMEQVELLMEQAETMGKQLEQLVQSTALVEQAILTNQELQVSLEHQDHQEHLEYLVHQTHQEAVELHQGNQVHLEVVL